MWHKGKGIIIYDPPRPRLKRKVDWWCIVDIDREITRYYRYWANQNPTWFGETRLDLCNPSWDSHISVIRGEIPRDDLMHLWRKYHGMEIEFRYSHEIRRSGDTTANDRPDNYFFVDVECPFLSRIREEFDKPANWKYHITIGRTWNSVK